MRVTYLSFLIFTPCLIASADLLGIPTVPFTTSSGDTFNLNSVRTITVDSKYADTLDQDGWTLIPPTLQGFAETFAEDLRNIVGCEVSLIHGEACSSQDIFLTIANSSAFQDAAGRFTSEGYMLQVAKNEITIIGASPLGVWWGTRTVLQQAVLHGGKLPIGSGTDSPGWNTRGIFVRGLPYRLREYASRIDAS